MCKCFTLLFKLFRTDNLYYFFSTEDFEKELRKQGVQKAEIQDICGEILGKDRKNGRRKPGLHYHKQSVN